VLNIVLENKNIQYLIFKRQHGGIPSEFIIGSLRTMSMGLETGDLRVKRMSSR
jgi:hypothetical protein